MPDLSLEQEAGRYGHHHIAGIDEVGRGPIAGPVVAAAVILTPDSLEKLPLARIDDSKKVSAKTRALLYGLLIDLVPVGIGIASVEEIDRINILQASMLAMSRATEQLPICPDYALVDGNRLPDLSCSAKAVVKGDSISLSIAAASIVAKVTRDRMMTALSASHPGYGWERNAGYGTAEHMAALARLGVTPIHRRSFAPVARQISALTSVN